ncbi:hypothetical protein TcG_07044 [Trypanosoma cruzi]|nr:hypothetical protein TcG_07044 [Trypanosoma cruzi]
MPAARTGPASARSPSRTRADAPLPRQVQAAPSHPSRTMQRILVIPLHAQRQKFRQSEAGGVPPPPPQTGAGLCSTSPLGSNMLRMALLTKPQRVPPKPHGAAMCPSNTRLVRALVDAVRPAPTTIP